MTIVISRLILSLRRFAETRRLPVYSRNDTPAATPDAWVSSYGSYLSTMVFRPRSLTSLEHSASRGSVSPEHARRSAVENWLAQVSDGIPEEARDADEKVVDVENGSDVRELSSLLTGPPC